MKYNYIFVISLSSSGGLHGATHGAHEDSLDLPELFCSLGSLIVEGRLPAEGQGQGEAASRGYSEGPHVELPGKISRHKCSDEEYLVSRKGAVGVNESAGPARARPRV